MLHDEATNQVPANPDKRYLPPPDPERKQNELLLAALVYANTSNQYEMSNRRLDNRQQTRWRIAEWRLRQACGWYIQHPTDKVDLSRELTKFIEKYGDEADNTEPLSEKIK